MSVIDTHCHLASGRFHGEVGDLIARASAAGVNALISQSTNLQDLIENVELSRAYEEVYFAAGIHPCDVHETPDDYLDALSSTLDEPKLAAIGETGLDYFHPAPEGWNDEAYHSRQRDFLKQHFELAEKAGLSVVLHTRDRSGSASFDDALEIASSFAGRVPFVFHCFPGPVELAERALEAGAFLSFTGIATFKNAKECLASALATPAGRLMVETDAPYLAPTPHRGKRCEPAFVSDTARFLAEARGETYEAFCDHTSLTARGFFRLS